MTKFLNRIPTGLCTAIVGALIVYATLTSNPLHGHSSWLNFPYSDKVVHFIMFFALSCALSFDYYQYTKENRHAWGIAIFIAIISSVCGVVIEVLQGLMNIGRSADMCDALADMLGAFVGIIAWRAFSKYVIDAKR